jgi:hypothetical protein
MIIRRNPDGDTRRSALRAAGGPCRSAPNPGRAARVPHSTPVIVTAVTASVKSRNS